MSPQTLKVAVTHTRFSYTGGIEKYIYSLVERLLDAGHEVHYLAARWEPFDHPRLTFHPVRWWRFPKHMRVLSFDWGVNKLLERHAFDLVHGFTKTTRQDIYTDGSGTLNEYVDATMADAPRWRRRLHLLTPHQRAISKMEAERFQRDRTLRIIPMAEFVKAQILARYPVDPARIEVLYNGVETELFSPAHRAALGPPFRSRHGIAPGARLLLFVGNDWRRKGLSTALEALARLRTGDSGLGDLQLAVAGHDNHPERYRAEATRLGIADAVAWLGPVREIRDAFAAADAFIFPTRYDVFGNVGLEALASGIPAVLSSRSGVGELLLEPVVGPHALAGERLEDPADPEELALKTRRVLEDRYAERSRAARALAEQYSWDRHFDRLLEIYAEVVAEKRAAR